MTAGRAGGLYIMETKLLRIEDKDYPALLKEIPRPPKKLYYRGDVSLLNTRCISIAGSRRASPGGLRAAELLGKRLAECGITVVSGLAEGVDTAAHKGALSAGGKTIAVLANGLDKCYPSGNRRLQSEIEDKGLLISEYHDGMTAQKHFFPVRNRIISGVSEATIIAEAALRSGSLITAEAADEQGRKVYAVAGNFTMTCCAGSNHLIADGVRPIVDINVFLEEIGAEPEAENKKPSGLSDDEAIIYEAVRREGEATTDDLVRDTLMPAGMVNGIVTVLEIKGLVQTEMGRVFLSVSGM